MEHSFFSNVCIHVLNLVNLVLTNLKIIGLVTQVNKIINLRWSAQLDQRVDALQPLPYLKMYIKSPGSVTITNRSQPPTPRPREKWQKLTRTKQTYTREAHRPAPSSPNEVITMLKGMTKDQDKEHEKTLHHEAPRSINHKATQNKNNTGTTALERSVLQSTGGEGLKIFLSVDKLHPGSRCIS